MFTRWGTNSTPLPSGNALGSSIHGLARRKTALRDDLAPCLAFEQLEYDGRDRQSVAGRGRVVDAKAADVVDREDVRVIERGRGQRLLLESPQPVRVRREVRRQHLDRDITPEPGVGGAVHLAHAAGAERRDDLVVPEAGPRGE
jgi:hypothetical protein